MKRHALLCLLCLSLVIFTACSRKSKTAAPADNGQGQAQGDLPPQQVVELPEGTTYFPEEGWVEKPDPHASPSAVPGGTLHMYAGPSPKSLNYYLETSTLAGSIFPLMYETLLDADSVTLADTPGLAERWAISPDLLTFTFWIDRRARWSDGQPITAADVKWTYDRIMSTPLAAPWQVDLSRFDEVKAIGERVVQFHAKEVHWKNLQGAGGFYIMPKHVFEQLNFVDVSFDFPVVSGLYRLGTFVENTSVSMIKRGDYWRAGSPRLQGLYNFAMIDFLFFGERANAFDGFQKGTIDIFPVYTASRWQKEATGDRYDKNWIAKQKIYNYNPVGFQGMAMNMRRFPFDDLRVRQAMACLIDRERMNRDIMYNQYMMHRSYYEDLYTPDEPCPNPLTAFDKERARALFAEAGWKANPATGILEKNGRPFRFTFLTRDQSTEKFLNIMREDFRDVGIDFTVDQRDWSSWMEAMDNFEFDMTWAAWGAGVRKDPESMWHSSQANKPSSNNITGFVDEQVDALIARQRTNFDIVERHAIVRDIDARIFPQMPYALLWYIDYARLLYWNKFGMPPTVLGRYGREDAAVAYWWIDPDAEANLERAQANGLALPPRPTEVRYDDVFKP